jgi:predicted N-acetyltransferase YhbS
MSFKIRPETPADYPAIAEVNYLAFGQPDEGKLVENLRRIRNLSLSFLLWLKPEEG